MDGTSHTQTPPQHVLVTGGLGYIGSHAVVRLLESGCRVSIVDNLANSRRSTLQRIAQICGRTPTLHVVDVRDEAALADVFARHAIDSVIHFAGLKAVGDSTRQPIDYYDVNVRGTLGLLRQMSAAGVRRIVFSSSATVYGEPEHVPIGECHPLAPINPYGRTKLMAEQVLRDLAMADPRWSIAALRYFNPAGAHTSGLIGDDPSGVPNNLLPFVGQVVAGQREMLGVFGTDYATPDGTAVRDYVHVMDLADAHVLALTRLGSERGFHAVNLGTGSGHSVLEVVAAYERASGRRVPRQLGPRRAGDAATCYADGALARRWLAWQPQRSLQDMCTDAWRFQQRAARQTVGEGMADITTNAKAETLGATVSRERKNPTVDEPASIRMRA